MSYVSNLQLRERNEKVGWEVQIPLSEELQNHLLGAVLLLSGDRCPGNSMEHRDVYRDEKDGSPIFTMVVERKFRVGVTCGHKVIMLRLEVGHSFLSFSYLKMPSVCFRGIRGMFSQACGLAYYTRPTDRHDETGGISRNLSTTGWC